MKVLTSCPSCLQGLSRYEGDTGMDADYIVVEMARHILGEGWMEDMCAAPTRAASSACWCSRHAPACWRASLLQTPGGFAGRFAVRGADQTRMASNPEQAPRQAVAGLMRHINDRYRYRRAGQAEVQRTTPQTMRAPPPPSGAGVSL